MSLTRLNIVATLLGNSDQVYYKYAQLKGSKGPVNCISFDQKGELLASGGDDEAVRVWDIATTKCVDVLEDPGKRWGQITCLTWLAGLGNDELKPIAFGTGRGLVVIYRRSRGDTRMVEMATNRVFEASDPVEALAFDEKKGTLAVTSHHGCVALYSIGRNGTMSELWSTKHVEAKNKKIHGIPRSILFYEGGKKILVFMLESGEMICIDAETAREEWRKVLKSGIGHASTCPTGKLLIDNLSKGFDLYDLPRSSPSQTFYAPSVKRCVKDGAFAEKASAIVCGSDHGKVYIFTKSSSNPIQVLSVAGKTVDVQAISTTTTSEAHLIASGISGGSFDITVWEKQIRKAKNHLNSDSQGKFALLNILIILLLLHLSSGIWGPVASRIWGPVATQGATRMLESMNVYRSSSGEKNMESVRRRSSGDREKEMEVAERLKWKKSLPNEELNDDDDDDEGDEWTKLRGDKWNEL